MSKLTNWRKVAGANYWVSCFGDVYSIRADRQLKPRAHPFGYHQVGIHQRNRYIHRLVAEAFIGPCPVGFDVCHIDGDPTNNRVENLRYDTRAGNHSDKKIHGTTYRPPSKLTKAEVLSIRDEPRVQTAIAEDYGVHQVTVSKIKLKKIWSHV